MNKQLTDLIAQRFIARPDVKAIQHADGTWSPHTKNGRRDGDRIGWTRSDLQEHIDGTRTFGHYMLSQQSKVKLFAFDIDFEKTDPNHPEQVFYYPANWSENQEDDEMIEFNPRLAWTKRSHPARPFLKWQLKMIAHEFSRVVTEELDLPCAVAYSGGKGVHVYGFTGLVDAAEAREGAQIVIDTLGHYKPKRGNNFFVDQNDDPLFGFKNLSIEVFPKQDTLDNKDLGNLMRLVLGKNLKNPKDPTFFIDMTSPIAQMVPVDSVHALAGNPWKKFGEVDG